jgi:glycosyltransferase involved in cell wall biosynthesis
MGTRELAAEAERSHGGWVDVLEPPVDLSHDRPDVDGAPFRQLLGLAPHEHLVVCVSRLSSDIKLGALVDAIDAIGELAAAGVSTRLVLVGDGDAAEPLRQRASAVNATCGRQAVVLTGALDDPRTAYAAADVVVGMGSSVLRAMAHRKPVVVQGTGGFVELLDEGSWSMFDWQGFFGRGASRSGSTRLAALLKALFNEPARRAALGRFGLETVHRRFSLEAAARRLAHMYERVAADRVAAAALAVDVVRASSRALAHEARLHLPARRKAGRQTLAAQLAAAAAPSDSLSSPTLVQNQS